MSLMSKQQVPHFQPDLWIIQVDYLKFIALKVFPSALSVWSGEYQSPCKSISALALPTEKFPPPFPAPHIK